VLRDAAVLVRQMLRDLPPPAAARQIAKLVSRALAGARPGRRVEGIGRRAAYDASMAVPFGFAPEAPTLRIAAACHMFHPDLAAEFYAALANIPGRLDVLLTTDTEDKRAALAASFAGWDKGTLEVRVVPNRGRDIGPKLTACGDLCASHDVVLFLHSKRDSHFADGPAWRRYLLHTLAGSPAIAGSILYAFQADPRLGIVMAQHWAPLRGRLDWGGNFHIARGLARRMGIGLTPGHVLDFPSGSMFWARPAALRPLLDLAWRAEDFPEEAGQRDSTVAHAAERLFLFVCEAAGYRWAKVADPAEAGSSGKMVRIDERAALEGFRRRHGFRLTALGPG
jgi:lipopolysaccharide biosynthesis protein